MPHKGPHISISPEFVVNRILRVNLADFAEWPESVRRLAIEIAEELFLLSYNPFINPDTVRASVTARFDGEKVALAHHYANSIGEGITMFWSTHEAETEFRDRLITAMRDILPEECIMPGPAALVENSTDATDLRMELPLLVVEPDNTEQVSALVRLANELKFALIPRGGGSGATGGSVPARRRTVIVSVTRLSRIKSVDSHNMTMTCEAGVLTNDAIKAAAAEGTLFTVDPASKQASTIGGNVAENAGGPFAFEYGTTLDNLLWWNMVTPTGEVIAIERENHPRHKILPEETATFMVKDISGGVRNVVHLRGDEIRRSGLGKDVTNKALGGLPGMQKEGVDGVITEACFILHPMPKLSRVLALEFFGRSMHPAALVISELVELRDHIRKDGDYARLSALEEFNAKYIKAIEYKRKSEKFDEDPISVIIVQIDGDEDHMLDRCVSEIVAIAQKQDQVDIHVARDAKEAELFWEDRHKLSAIAKRTSGFKLNEDVVIPMNRIPDFALFLEQLNLECAAAAMRHALQEIGRLPGFPMEDKEFNREFSHATKAAIGDVSAKDLSDEEMELRAVLFLNELATKYTHLQKQIARIHEYMLGSRVIVASHMHAGDGNCHVNIPVNSNDPRMLELAEETAARVMATAQEMGGEVSGEHGIGITKIAFFNKEKMDALREFKARVDPRDVFNPAKLVQRDLPVRPFTFSFNRLINDIRESGLADKELLIRLLTTVQVCTRCGKCKQVCSMTCPERSMQRHPRNKNIVLGMLLEAMYYAQVNTGRMDQRLLQELRNMFEHCTGCGRCSAVCPVKIPSAEVALSLRAVLEHENAGGHPVKSRVLQWLSKAPEERVPRMAKLASLGQKAQNNFIGFVPEGWRKRMKSPLFTGKGPKIGYTNLYESLKLKKGNGKSIIFTPAEPNKDMPAVLYFPGCGCSLFYDRAGMASIMLLLKAGAAVAVPSRHICCGYPVLSSGADAIFKANMAEGRRNLLDVLSEMRDAGLNPGHIITSCGSCANAIARHNLNENEPDLKHSDITQFVLPRLPELKEPAGGCVIYHSACHLEWTDTHKIKGPPQVAKSLAEHSGARVELSSGCCGESGLGAICSPSIYNILREKKTNNLKDMLENCPGPMLMGCPSCKIGIGRILLGLHDKRPVLHVAEWLALLHNGENWRQDFKKKASESKNGLRIVAGA